MPLREAREQAGASSLRQAARARKARLWFAGISSSCRDWTTDGCSVLASNIGAPLASFCARNACALPRSLYSAGVECSTARGVSTTATSPASDPSMAHTGASASRDAALWRALLMLRSASPFEQSILRGRSETQAADDFL